MAARPGENASWTFAVSAKGRTASSAPCATTTRSTGWSAKRKVPATILDRSSRSSIMWARATAFRSIVAIACVERSGANCFEPSMRDHPSTAFRGVRSSCETVARNSSLRRLACSASSVIVCARTDPTTRCSFASRSSVMSCSSCARARAASSRARTASARSVEISWRRAAGSSLAPPGDSRFATLFSSVIFSVADAP
jgi:hypothetical protein